MEIWAFQTLRLPLSTYLKYLITRLQCVCEPQCTCFIKTVPCTHTQTPSRGNEQTPQPGGLRQTAHMIKIGISCAFRSPARPPLKDCQLFLATYCGPGASCTGVHGEVGRPGEHTPCGEIPTTMLHFAGETNELWMRKISSPVTLQPA